MTVIKDLQSEIKQFVDERDWSQFHNYKDLAISLSLEASELLEHFQWKDNEKLNQYAVEQKENIAEEIADVFYWVLLISNKLDINLADEFHKKMVKNTIKYPIDKSKGKSDKYNLL
jgi:dCTP diphosphatase